MDKKSTTTPPGAKPRLTKEQLEAIKGGVSRTLPGELLKPVFYTVPPSMK